MPLTSYREAILEGAQAAHRLHVQLGTKDLVETGRLSSVDVFRAVAESGAAMLFRPLGGLQGAFLGPPAFASEGIIVSTKYPLHVQRFTAAHELGHLLMGHAPSFDSQVGLWRGEGRDLQEVAADSFASEFLMPLWLFVHHARNHRWSAAALSEPSVAYQLSLRLGASYEATCWGLRGHRIVGSKVADTLATHEPKTMKLGALAGRHLERDSRANVWVVEPGDHRQRLEGNPTDLILFRFPERTTEGYVWDEGALQAAGLEVVDDWRTNETIDDVGGPVTRTIATRAPENGGGHYPIALTERRPWDPDDQITALEVELDLFGREVGLPRFARGDRLAA
ncbi:MAG: ImmA/IrrE family metallo-endopeptidase [Deltaproteobacteria bacterium]|nr:ImmA/IrrE family metallo-endopeptidase [Deltaproteobacteria bacterium]